MYNYLHTWRLSTRYLKTNPYAKLMVIIKNKFHGTFQFGVALCLMTRKAHV
jgi:hypothetical protein